MDLFHPSICFKLFSVAADNGIENNVVFDSGKKYTFEAKAPEMLMKRKS